VVPQASRRITFGSAKSLEKRCAESCNDDRSANHKWKCEICWRLRGRQVLQEHGASQRCNHAAEREDWLCSRARDGRQRCNMQVLEYPFFNLCITCYIAQSPRELQGDSGNRLVQFAIESQDGSSAMPVTEIESSPFSRSNCKYLSVNAPY